MSRRPNRPEDIFKWINTHNNDPNVCWEWLGTLSGRDERGYFSIHNKRYLCHRVVFELFNGPIPPRLVVRHKCDHTYCCNPTHLELGTRSQNEHDKYDRDRSGYSLDVLKTIARFGKQHMKHKDIVAEVQYRHGVSISISGVGKVLRGERRAKQINASKREEIK